jgi:membrane-associated phospholipid phosphatase
MPLTIIDKSIVFEPYFLYWYFSLWIYVSLMPALIRTKKELFYYGAYITTVCMLGIVSYIMFPAVIPENGIDYSYYPEFSLLKSMDTTGNAFPSLHVATAFFSFFWMNRQLEQMNATLFFKVLSALWCLGIIYSTMAIKQHVFIDVVGGLILGGVFAWLTFRHHRLHVEGELN